MCVARLCSQCSAKSQCRFAPCLRIATSFLLGKPGRTCWNVPHGGAGAGVGEPPPCRALHLHLVSIVRLPLPSRSRSPSTRLYRLRLSLDFGGDSLPPSPRRSSAPCSLSGKLSFALGSIARASDLHTALLCGCLFSSALGPELGSLMKLCIPSQSITDCSGEVGAVDLVFPLQCHPPSHGVSRA
jgi:hypothetical protein